MSPTKSTHQEQYTIMNTTSTHHQHHTCHEHTNINTRSSTQQPWTPASAGMTDRVLGLPTDTPEAVGYNIISVLKITVSDHIIL